MNKQKGPLEKVRVGLEKLKKDTYKRPTPVVYGRTYFYVFGFTWGGKTVVYGPESLREAERDLATLQDGEIFELTTRNIAEATREIKKTLIDRGESPDEALRRMLHKKPMDEGRKGGRK